MSSYELKDKEKVLFEEFVNIKEYKNETKLTITSERLILEKKHWLFKNKYKVKDIIKIKQIKTVKSEPKVKEKKVIVTISTSGKEYHIESNDILTTIRITDAIKTAQTKENLAIRTAKGAKKAIKFGKEVKDVVTTLGVAVAGVIIWLKGKK